MKTHHSDVPKQLMYITIKWCYPGKGLNNLCTWYFNFENVGSLLPGWSSSGTFYILSTTIRLICNKQMNIFIGYKFFVQNSVNHWKLGLTLAPSMLEFVVVCSKMFITPLKCQDSKSHFMQWVANSDHQTKSYKYSRYYKNSTESSIFFFLGKIGLSGSGHSVTFWG